jgi:tRNA(Arg) A34 adenosine deaminase TadA
MKISEIKTLVFVFLAFFCISVFAHEEHHPKLLSPEQKERDQIFTLLAYSIVYEDWQTKTAGRRGHNIGSVLVDQTGKAVFWARNSVKELNNRTQHGEVRLIENFLNCDDITEYATGYTVYTTLEPCAMCTGLMTLTKVSRVVFGQTDTGYGGVREKLNADPSYPNIYDATSADFVLQKQELDKGYATYKQNSSSPSITEYLLSEDARKIYKSAIDEINNFKPKYKSNEESLISAKKLLSRNMKEALTDEEMKDRCPN